MTQCTISQLYALKTSASQAAIDLSRSVCERRRCNHWQTSPFPSSLCIRKIIGSDANPLHYTVVTQDPALRKELREQVPGVPLIYLNKGGVLVLEEEGPASERKRREMEQGKRHVPQEELAILRGANVASSTLPNATAGPSNSEPPPDASTLASGATHDPSSHSRPSATSAPNAEESNPFATHAASRLDKKLQKARTFNKKKKKGGPNPLSVKKKQKKSGDQGKGKGKGKAKSSVSGGAKAAVAGSPGKGKTKV